MAPGRDLVLVLSFPGEERPADARIMAECIHACARYGYYRIIYDSAPMLDPKDPDDDVKQLMPAACMP